MCAEYTKRARPSAPPLCYFACDEGAPITGVDDAPAIALDTKLGLREDVLHFDVAVDGRESA